MTDRTKTPTVLTDRALEMVMRDVIDSMIEYSLESGLEPSDGGFEIIEICPAHRREAAARQRTNKKAEKADSEIIEFPDLRRATG